MENDKGDLARIKLVLQKNPRGMNISEIADAIGMNRMAAARFLDILVITGDVDMKAFGPAKVYYLSRRMPISAMLSLSSDHIIVLDKDAKVVHVNDKFLELAGINRFEMLYKKFDHFAIYDLFKPFIHNKIQEGIDGKESAAEAWIDTDGKTRFFNVKVIPTVLNEGERGVTILAEDITERSQLKSRLNAIFSPGDMDEKTIAEIVDIPKLQEMADAFYSMTGVGISIIDLEGKVLVGAGWQDICTKFHRCHPETLRNCIESDTHLSSKMAEGEYVVYQCKNGMWDMVTPIIVNGKHIADLFSGQFFFDDETLDYDRFRQQAKKYGFNEDEYIKALERAPKHGREKVRKVMEAYTKFASLVSQMSYSNARLAKSLIEQREIEEELRERQEKINTSKRE